MVVLRMGGLYADVDTECRRAMDDIIKPRDTLLAGWENEFATPEIAAHRNYARTRQVLQWVFAAAPGHPALREICDHIAQNVYTVFSQNTNRDTLERTGPGVFTDYVLKHAAMHPPSKVTPLARYAWETVLVYGATLPMPSGSVAMLTFASVPEGCTSTNTVRSTIIHY